MDNEKNSDYTCIITDRNTVSEDIRNVYKENENEEGFEELPYISLNDPSEGSFWTNIIPILSFVLIGIMVILSFCQCAEEKVQQRFEFRQDQSTPKYW